MKQAIVDLMSSKKFITAIVGVAVALGAKFGLALDPELVAAIIGLFGIAIAAQGATDHGREAAQINATAAANTAAIAAGWQPIVPAQTSGEITVVKPNGFIAPRLLVMLAAVGFALMACGAAARQRTIVTSLAAVDSAVATFVAYDGPHQLDIVSQALNRDDATEKLAAYRKSRAKFNLAVKAAYAAIKLAATVDDDHSVAGMVAATAEAATDLTTLGVTP